RATLQSEEAGKRFFEAATQLDEIAFETPDSLQPGADALGLEIARVSGITRLSGEAVGQHPEVRAALFNEAVLYDGENTRALELRDGSVVVARVVAVTPEQEKPLVDVRDVIIAQLQGEVAAQQAAELAESLKSELTNNESFETLITKHDLETNGFNWISRRDTEVPEAIRTSVFAATGISPSSPKVGIEQLPGGNVGVYVARAVQPGVGVTTNQTIQLAQSIGDQEVTSYQQSLRQQADIDVDLDRLE
ncbi:MAG: hypothetical protein HKM24_07845, partial [Gammaproteobacteria bacterium]|nr:hypothetical protein [Gammaproteobacteria bacterium]